MAKIRRKCHGIDRRIGERPPRRRSNEGANFPLPPSFSHTHINPHTKNHKNIHANTRARKSAKTYIHVNTHTHGHTRAKMCTHVRSVFGCVCQLHVMQQIAKERPLHTPPLQFRQKWGCAKLHRHSDDNNNRGLTCASIDPWPRKVGLGCCCCCRAPCCRWRRKCSLAIPPVDFLRWVSGDDSSRDLMKEVIVPMKTTTATSRSVLIADTLGWLYPLAANHFSSVTVSVDPCTVFVFVCLCRFHWFFLSRNHLTQIFLGHQGCSFWQS